MFKKLAVITIAVATVVGVAGCSPRMSVEEKSKIEAGFVIEPMTPQDGADFDQGYYEVIDKNSIGVHLAGSGSCPPVIESAVMSDPYTVQLRLKDWGNRACTMDYRAYSQKVSNPSEKINIEQYKFEICTPLNECSVLTKKQSETSEV